MLGARLFLTLIYISGAGRQNGAGDGADYVAAGATIVEGKNRITALKCPMALRLSGLRDKNG
ncbi:hypothetical protein KCP71_08675 [Salmonella enterica subsp. enterica]|nr:hypothetical protein KCP71_08675 [Salmonella enterica subsp. enterica]